MGLLFAFSYCKLVTEVATHDPLTKSKATNDPKTGNLNTRITAVSVAAQKNHNFTCV